MLLLSTSVAYCDRTPSEGRHADLPPRLLGGDLLALRTPCLDPAATGYEQPLPTLIESDEDPIAGAAYRRAFGDGIIART